MENYFRNANTVNEFPATVTLFGLRIQALDFAQSVDLLIDACKRSYAQVVVTVNVDHLVWLDKNPSLKEKYASANFIFADGMPVVWVSHLLGCPLPSRVTGVDLFVALCRRAIAENKRVLVVGGMPGEELMLLERYARYYPGLDVQVLCPSANFDPEGAEGALLAERIRQAAPDFIFVCLGFPKQERWALLYAPTFNSGVILCVGAAQEFALGLQARSPLWMQTKGLEWLWRLITNPAKLWRRYLVKGPGFFPIAFREWKNRNR